MPTPRLRRYTLTLTGHKPTPASYNPLSYFRAAPDNSGFTVNFHTGTPAGTSNPEDTLNNIINTLHRAAHLKPINKVRFEDGEPVISIDKTATQTQKSDVLNTAISALSTHLRERDKLGERYNIPLVQPIYYSDSEFETFLETLADKHPDESIFIDIIDQRTDPAVTPDAEEQTTSHIYYYNSVDGVTLTTDSQEDLLKTLTDSLYWQSLSIDEQDAILETKGEASTARTKAQAKACLSLTAALGLASVGAYFLGPLCLTATTAAPTAGAAVWGGDVTPAAGGHYATVRDTVTTAIGDIEITASSFGNQVTFNSSLEDSFGNYIEAGDIDGDNIDDIIIAADTASPLSRIAAGSIDAFKGNIGLANGAVTTTEHTSIIGDNTGGAIRLVAVLNANGDTFDDIAVYADFTPALTIITGRTDYFSTENIDLASPLSTNGFQITGPDNSFGKGVAQLQLSSGTWITAISAPTSGKVYVIAGLLSDFSGSDITTLPTNTMEITAPINIAFGDIDAIDLRENKDGNSVSVLIGAPSKDNSLSDDGSVYDCSIPTNPGSWPTSLDVSDPSVLEIQGTLNAGRLGTFVARGTDSLNLDTLLFTEPRIFDSTGYHHHAEYNRSTTLGTKFVANLSPTTWESVMFSHPIRHLNGFISSGSEELALGTYGTTGEGQIHIFPYTSPGFLVNTATVSANGGATISGAPSSNFGIAFAISSKFSTTASFPSLASGCNQGGYASVTNPITIQTDFAVDAGAILEGDGIQPINLGINTLNARSGTATLEITFDDTPVGTLSTNNLPAGITQTPITNGIRLEGSNADILTAATSTIYYTPDNPDWNSELEGDVVFNRVAYDSTNPAQTASETFTLTVTPTVDDPILFPAVLNAAFPNNTFEQNQLRSRTVLIDDVLDDPDGVFDPDNFTYNITTPPGLEGFRAIDRLRVEGSATMGGAQTLLFDICRTSPPGYCAQTNVTTYITPVPTTTPAPNTTTTTTTTRSPDEPNPNGSEEESSGNFLAVVSASGVGGALVLWSALTCLIRCCTTPKRESLRDKNNTASDAKPGKVASVCGPLIAAALQDVVTNAYMEDGSAYETSIMILLQALHEKNWNVLRIMKILVSLVEDDSVILEILRRPGFKSRFIEVLGNSLLTNDELKTLGNNQDASYEHAAVLLKQKTPEELLAHLRADIPPLFDDTRRQRSARELRLQIAKAVEKGSYEKWSTISIASAGRCCGTCTSKPTHAEMNRFTAQIAGKLDAIFQSYQNLHDRHKVANNAHLFASAPGASASASGAIEMDSLNPIFGETSDPHGSVDSSGGLTDLSTGSTGFGASGS